MTNNCISGLLLMSEFKYLHLINFEHYLKLYELVSNSIQQELSKQEPSAQKPYNQGLKTLIETTFLQMYALLEESLYLECKQHVLKKNASIVRFEPALKAQGFNTENDSWTALLHVSKIRNCLLHGNGRLDNDRYGEDTRNTIFYLNEVAKKLLIKITELEETSKLRLHENLLYYYPILIKNFIDAQK